MIKKLIIENIMNQILLFYLENQEVITVITHLTQVHFKKIY
jgi:hypothetical protein